MCVTASWDSMPSALSCLFEGETAAVLIRRSMVGVWEAIWEAAERTEDWLERSRMMVTGLLLGFWLRMVWTMASRLAGVREARISLLGLSWAMLMARVPPMDFGLTPVITTSGC